MTDTQALRIIDLYHGYNFQRQNWFEFSWRVHRSPGVYCEPGPRVPVLVLLRLQRGGFLDKRGRLTDAAFKKMPHFQPWTLGDYLRLEKLGVTFQRVDGTNFVPSRDGIPSDKAIWER